MPFHALQCFRYAPNVKVQLSAARIALDHFANEIAKGPSRLRHESSNKQERQHSAIAIPMISEIMMSANLAAVDCILLAHFFFDKCVPSSSPHLSPTELFVDICGL